MSDAGLWLARKERRRVQQPRLRRSRLGELIQIDGSDARGPLRAACIRRRRNTKYSTFGVISNPSDVLPGVSDPRFLGPGAPFGI
jgi:hypothetical protein